MNATLSSWGQIVIPQEVRERCDLREGDHFIVEDNPSTQSVTLRKVKAPGNWFDVYMQCPGSFKIPRRHHQFYRPKHELAD
jgi:AbrB family looped-hinge helix DNA binding protein